MARILDAEAENDYLPKTLPSTVQLDMIGDELNILQFILLCHGQVSPVCDQLLRLYLSEIVAIIGEGQFQEIFDG